MGRLFWKFFLAILLAQLAATLGIGAAFWLRDQARSLGTAEVRLTPQLDTGPFAELVIDSAAATLKHGGVAALRDMVAGTSGVRIYVIDDAGKDIIGRTITPALRSEAERARFIGASASAVRHLTGPDGHRYMVFLRRSDDGLQPMSRPGPGFGAAPPMFSAGQRPPPPLHGGPGRPPPDGSLLPYIMLAVGTLASLLFAALLAWHFSRPIRALRKAFEAAASGDLGPRFADARPGRGDELADLGRDFDRMSGQLRALMDNQRRLLHDVSHELRSPLARLQAAIGLAHQQPDKLAASLDRIAREGVRMDELIGQLLTLSRVNSQGVMQKAEDVPLMDLLEEIAADASFEAEQMQRRVTLHGDAAVHVRGAPDLLWRAIENLVRNAIKHSPEGGTVEIALERDGQSAQVQVLDRGPGVVPDDLEAIFQPFYRSDPNANNSDGHGLGLAIAQGVVEAHGGTIHASNRPGGGLQVTLAIPCSPSTAPRH